MTQEQINLVCGKAYEITQEFKKEGLIAKHKVGEHEIKMQEVIKNLIIPVVSQRSELLPDFLYEDDGIIKVGVHGDSAVTDEWNDYLKKLGNCG